MSDSDERGQRTAADTPGQRTAADTPVVDVTLIDEMLRMTPAERLRQNDRMAAVAVKLRTAFAQKEGEWKTSDS